MHQKPYHPELFKSHTKETLEASLLNCLGSLHIVGLADHYRIWADFYIAGLMIKDGFIPLHVIEFGESYDYVKVVFNEDDEAYRRLKYS